MLNIVLRPTPEVAASAIALSQKITFGQNPHFVLDGKQYNPHVTLYKIGVLEENIQGIQTVLDRLASRSRPEPCRILGSGTGRGYLLFRVNREPIWELHRHAVEYASPFRFHASRIWGKRENSMTPEETRNNKQYGHPNVLDEYHPHMTITRFHDQTTAEIVASDTRWDAPFFHPESLALYTVGGHGTCKELIHEARFK